MPHRGAASRTSLAALVRVRREDLHLTMNELAERANISRTTLHRIEHASDIRPSAPKLAQVLALLEIQPDELRAVLDEDRYRDDVLHWLERSNAFARTKKDLEPNQALARLVDTTDPGIVVLKDNLMTEIRGAGVEEIRDVLKAAGWLVMRPD